jgi:hypothetical protein
VMETRPRHTSARLGLVGLLLLSAFSLAAAEEEEVQVTLRRISTGEVREILGTFPEMIPGWLASPKTDTNSLAHLFRFSEVSSPRLERAFPNARFYKGLGFSKPPYPYLMAIAGDQRYIMPAGFNQLLLDNGQRVTDRNVLELAKAFVVLAAAEKPVPSPFSGDPDNIDSVPSVTFVDAARTRSRTGDTTFHDAKLEVRVGERVAVWRLSASIRPGQFDFVSWRAANGDYMDYLPVIVESLPKR